MRLFNETISAVKPTGTHVDHVVLWLLLLLAKTMQFSFLKALSVDLTFIKNLDSYNRGMVFGAKTSK